MADSTGTSPQKHYRVAQLKDFLPLSSQEQSSISTRGQSLSGIIQSRSTSNLSALRQNSYLRRRASSFGEDLERQQSHESSEDELPEMQSRVLGGGHWGAGHSEEYKRKMSVPASLVTPQMRSQRLIGNSNPRYRWEQYWKSEEELRHMSKPIRKYYERCNYLVQRE